jgi:hypothetical protein
LGDLIASLPIVFSELEFNRREIAAPAVLARFIADEQLEKPHALE